MHHGNGIQRMFEEDPRVLYVSLHRLDIFPFKPDEADCNVIGSGRGAGYTINIAWPRVSSYDFYVTEFILPVILFLSRPEWVTQNTWQVRFT